MKGMSDSYKLYCKKVEDSVDITTYRNLTELFIQFIINKLAKGDIVRLPEGLGDLHFAGKKIKPKIDENGEIKKLTVDWKATQLNWKTNPPTETNKNYVYHFNEHTCGIRYKFIWSRRPCVVKNKMFYVFIPARAVKRKFAQIVINEETEFIVRRNIYIEEK